MQAPGQGPKNVKHLVKDRNTEKNTRSEAPVSACSIAARVPAAAARVRTARVAAKVPAAAAAAIALILLLLLLLLQPLPMLPMSRKPGLVAHALLALLAWLQA